jgi:hypothetical protein
VVTHVDRQAPWTVSFPTRRRFLIPIPIGDQCPAQGSERGMAREQFSCASCRPFRPSGHEVGLETGGIGRAAGCGQSPPQRPASLARAPRVWRRAVPMRPEIGPRLLFPANLLPFPAFREAYWQAFVPCKAQPPKKPSAANSGRSAGAGDIPAEPINSAAPVVSPPQHPRPK